MTTLLFGDNSFEIQRAVEKIINDFDGEVEKIDGSKLQSAQLPDILMGTSLFSFKRTLVIRDLSENKVVWPVFGEWLSKISDDINLVLVEHKLDKRTATFKILKNNYDVKEFQPFSERDWLIAEKWVASEADKHGIEMSKKCVQVLVQRVGIDQWRLISALEKLALVDTITVDVIYDIIDANPIENVFNLFEIALRGDIEKLINTIRILEKSEDVFRLCALLSSQAFQLAVVVSASKNDNVVKDFGIHPYVLSKLSLIAKRLGKSGVSEIVSIFTELDDDLKLSKADPWLLVERALIKITNI
jgi:DNA polymerase III delta subunit